MEPVCVPSVLKIPIEQLGGLADTLRRSSTTVKHIHLCLVYYIVIL